jgi:N-acetylmuramic acid 6-phosphate etherase
MTNTPDPYFHLVTETPNPESLHLDKLSPLEFVDLMQREESRVLSALEGVREQLAELIEELAGRFGRGGRLFYVGAGTSGRLGMLDATECPPTFGTLPNQVQAILAGGFECLVRSVEGAEDQSAQGGNAIRERGVSNLDMVVGIAASSTTPFVRGALEQAAGLGAYTVLLTCNPPQDRSLPIDRWIVLETGPEVLTGSTRLKAGTATKLFLNRLTTGAMIRLGKVYRNRMVDLYLTCSKLRHRAIRTTCDFTGLNWEEAESLLKKVGGSVKVAILVNQKSLTPSAAKLVLEENGGKLSAALGEVKN